MEINHTWSSKHYHVCWNKIYKVFNFTSLSYLVTFWNTDIRYSCWTSLRNNKCLILLSMNIFIVWKQSLCSVPANRLDLQLELPSTHLCVWHLSVKKENLRWNTWNKDTPSWSINTFRKYEWHCSSF